MPTTNCFYTLEPLVLASASPRRQAFLRDMGLHFQCLRPSGIEPQPEVAETPVDYAQRAADAKAHAVAESLSSPQGLSAAVLAADTVVALAPEMFGKPQSPEHALSMLKELSGRTHTVTTAVSLIVPDEKRILRLHRSTTVTFHPWPESVLQAYVRTGEPMDKAGAYAIQGQGAFLVEKIEGSWSSVVGLPLAEVLALLLREKIIGMG